MHHFYRQVCDIEQFQQKIDLEWFIKKTFDPRDFRYGLNIWE